jgi:death-on-curing protein
METFLVLNGHELPAVVDEQEEVIMSLASGQMSREQLADWIVSQLVRREPENRA